MPRNGPRQARQPVVGPERPHQTADLHEPELERAGQALEIVPILNDHAGLRLVRGELIGGAVTGLRIDAPESRASDIGDTRAELVAFHRRRDWEAAAGWLIERAKP